MCLSIVSEKIFCIFFVNDIFSSNSVIKTQFSKKFFKKTAWEAVFAILTVFVIFYDFSTNFYYNIRDGDLRGENLALSTVFLTI